MEQFPPQNNMLPSCDSIYNPYDVFEASLNNVIYCQPNYANMQPHYIDPNDEWTPSAMNKRKRGKPQRALSSAVVPVGGTTSGPSVQFMDADRTAYYDEQRGGSSSEDHATQNIMSIQSMLNNSGNVPQPPQAQDQEQGEYSEKSWRRNSDKYKRSSREGVKGYNEFGYREQSWQETLEKAVRGKQEKEMLDELATILELPTKNFPHNTARLCYAKLEALKLLRETCNRGLISEELYAEKQQEFLDSMQF